VRPLLPHMRIRSYPWGSRSFSGVRYSRGKKEAGEQLINSQRDRGWKALLGEGVASVPDVAKPVVRPVSRKLVVLVGTVKLYEFFYYWSQL
jgi:hypothetical protein